jgi:predicted O-linked N-acetylglucosamine transferase (SPINDLY family)
MNLDATLQDAWRNQRYHQVIEIYETILQNDTVSQLAPYWYLGLAYLLIDDEETSQSTWFYALSQLSEDEIPQAIQELSNLLEEEVQRQIELQNIEKAWIIRQHIRELLPESLLNLLHLILLSHDLNLFEDKTLQDWDVITLLKPNSLNQIENELLLEVNTKLLSNPTTTVIKFVRQSVLVADLVKEQWLQALFPIMIQTGDEKEKPLLAADLAEICLSIEPNNIEFLRHLARFRTNAHQFKRALETAHQFFALSQTLEHQFLSNYQILRILTYSGDWLEVEPYAERHKQLLRQMLRQDSSTLGLDLIHSLVACTGFLAYLEDDALGNYSLRAGVSKLFQDRLSITPPVKYQCLGNTEPIRIGYIAHTLRSHSVGWLSRWLFQHHDRERFHTHIYFVNRNFEDEFYNQWFKDCVDKAQGFGIEAFEIAQKIYDDQIQILVDLDSVTLNVTYEVMARKPAPVQVSWLGWDAPGLDSIDYFIADPYVLPESAEDFYQEKPWRLPSTYLAVDGFEVGISTLRREDLNIPSDSVIYFSAQAGAKRHPSTVRLQLKIMKEVPHSYFLIKGIGEQSLIQEFFTYLAEEEGVNPERLKFLPKDPNEYVHRANLQIADVVLDTYPYNGATTTLETLWMCIPLVTRVGQTFSSRNSYAFLKNVGVTEGIAWTDEEYIEWGIRLGQDEQLRQEISWKLKQSRKNSPLWNAKEFTLEMENAYQQMWRNYLEQQ